MFATVKRNHETCSFTEVRHNQICYLCCDWLQFTQFLHLFFIYLCYKCNTYTTI